MGHHHHPIDPTSGDRRVSISIWANGLLTIVQIVGGILAGSLSLIADALHNFSDMAALVIAFAARKIARRPPDSQMTFGYGRIEIVAALINYTTLILVGIYLIYEGAMRMIDPPEIQGWAIVLIGAVALAVDALTALFTWSTTSCAASRRNSALNVLFRVFISHLILYVSDHTLKIRWPNSLCHYSFGIGHSSLEFEHADHAHQDANLYGHE